jgi:hypothetical protein
MAYDNVVCTFVKAFCLEVATLFIYNLKLCTFILLHTIIQLHPLMQCSISEV